MKRSVFSRVLRILISASPFYLSGCIALLAVPGVMDGMEKNKARRAAENDVLMKVGSGEAPVPYDLARRLLLGTLQGTICRGRYPVKVVISDVIDLQNGQFKLVGSVTTPALPEKNQNIKLDGLLEGSTGVLSLSDNLIAKSKRTVVLQLARDNEGKGWAGAFVAEALDDCNDIVASNRNGATTSLLRPLTPALFDGVGLNLSEPRDLANEAPPPNGLFWAAIFAQQGDQESAYLLARGAEYKDRASQAIELYERSASIHKDVRAQRALARIYEKGLGTPKDPKAAEIWKTLADSQSRSAGEICASDRFSRTALSLLREEQQDPAIRFAQLLTLALSGLNVDLGTTYIRSISLKSFTSPGRQYTCTVSAYNVGAWITNHSPDYEYSHTDQEGVLWYADKRLDNAIKDFVAEKAIDLSKGTFVRSFRVRLIADRTFRITLMPGPIGPRSATVDFDPLSLDKPSSDDASGLYGACKSNFDCRKDLVCREAKCVYAK